MPTIFTHNSKQKLNQLERAIGLTLAMSYVWACAVPHSHRVDNVSSVRGTEQQDAGAISATFGLHDGASQPQGTWASESSDNPTGPAGSEAADASESSGTNESEPLPEQTYLSVVLGEQSGGIGSERIAALSPGACLKELRRRGIAVAKAGKPAQGVATPLRIERNLGEVRWVTPNKQSIYGIVDCRLIVALEELSKRLASLSVKEVHVDNFYRPKAHLPGKKTKRSQHAYGLAVDIHALVLTDGTILRIEDDFGGEVGGELCGAQAAFSVKTRKSVLLRNIVCSIASSRTFSYLLTPNYDSAHHNHLHGDIKRGCGDHFAR